MSNKDLSNDVCAVLDLIHGCFEPSALSAPMPDTSIERLLAVSKSLGLSALTAYALKKRGFDDPEIKITLAKAQRLSVLYEVEYQRISNAMQEAGVYHLPMKGMAIRHLYPAFGLREMTDMDIWFDADYAETLRNIMTDLGYAVKQFDSSKHDVYEKPPVCAEMHRRPINCKLLPGCEDYYQAQWEELIRQHPDSYVLSESLEDTLVYLLVHTYKHYKMAGAGVRALLDVYILLHHRDACIDKEIVLRKCRTLGIAEFAELVLRLSANLFSRQELTPAEAQCLDEFLCSGIYGSMDQYYSNAIKEYADKSGKKGYVLSRLRMPDNQLDHHPILARHRILRPFYLPVRLLSTLYHRPRMLIKELKILRRIK